MGAVYSAEAADGSAAAAAESGAGGGESISHRCSVLHEKLDLLLGTLHDEVVSASRHPSVDDDELPSDDHHVRVRPTVSILLCSVVL